MLRSSTFSLQHIYAVHRLSNNLDEPPRSMVQSLLQKILVFKGGVKPPKSRPLQIPLLSHQGFRTIQAWLRETVISRNDFFPFHFPPCNVVAAARLSLGKLLGNHRKMMEEFDWDTPPMCICRSFQERHFEASMVKHPNDESQHVATRLCSLNVSARMKYITGVSAKTQVYPKFQDYLESTWAQLTTWAIRHHVGGLQPQDWEQLITEEWQLHYPESQYLLSMQDVKFIISVVRGFVAQGREHAPGDLHVFYPNFYWQVLKNTFGDTRVYSSSLLSPAEAQAFFQEKAFKKWLKPYRWGINKHATVPISYVLLKKKQFAVARPIISYSNFVFGRLFCAASTC